MPIDDGPITSVAQLLAPHDRSFIHAAYRSVLGRPPEPEGEAYYLARLRGGAHKLSILKQLRRSPEGRTFVPGVAGLDRAIKRQIWTTKPLIGPMVRFFTGAEGNGATQRQLRILANEIGRVHAEQTKLRSELDLVTSFVKQLVAQPVASPEGGTTNPLPSEPPPIPSVTPPPIFDMGPVPDTLDSTERRLLARLRVLALTSGASA